MYNHNRNLPAVIRRTLTDSLHRLQVISQRPIVRVSAILAVAFVISQKEFSFSVSFGNGQNSSTQIASALVETNPTAVQHFNTNPNLKSSASNPQSSTQSDANNRPRPVAVANSSAQNANTDAEKIWWEEIKEDSRRMSVLTKPKTSQQGEEMNLANPATAVSDALTPAQKEKAATYSNLGFVLNPNYAAQHGVDPQIVAVKNQLVFDYVQKYLATAQEEAKLFNIPVSITLAQGLLESNAGESSLARKENNHFGIKCRDKCVGCRCANYTDDSKFDMFRIFDTPWQSFREHSKLLTNPRYKHLLNLPRTDYKNWAYGLKAAGYATDANYASKLIAIIESLKLNQHDL